MNTHLYMGPLHASLASLLKYVTVTLCVWVLDRECTLEEKGWGARDVSGFGSKTKSV